MKYFFAGLVLGWITVGVLFAATDGWTSYEKTEVINLLREIAHNTEK